MLTEASKPNVDSVFTSNVIAVAVLSELGEIQDANQRFADELGYPLKRLINAHIQILLSDSKTLNQLFKEHLRNQTFSFKHKNGQDIPLVISSEKNQETLCTTIYAQKAEKQLELSNDFEMFRSIIRSSSDSVYLIDTEYRFREVSNLWLGFRDFKRNHVIGQSMLQVAGEEYFEQVKPFVDEALAGITVSRKQWLEHPQRGLIHLDISYQSVLDVNKTVIGVLGTGRDVTESKLLANKLEQQEQYDELTGFLNRRKFTQELEYLCNASVSQEAVLAYLDLDQFKIVNDTAGHAAGDELIKQVGEIIKTNIRTADLLARLGGDEFGLILLGCPLTKGKDILQKTLADLQNFNFFWDEQVFKVSASVGLVDIKHNNHTPEQLMSMADVACYSAKDAGRNRLHIYHEENSEANDRHSELLKVNDIRLALEEDRFCLFYQAIEPSDSESKLDTVYEVLLRLKDKDNKIVSPAAFIPSAERYGFMAELDKWVIKTVLHTYGQAFDSFAKGIVSINLSGNSLSDESMLAYIQQSFDSSLLDPNRICFEITETAVISNLTAALKLIEGLKTLGCRLALDDFGSGLSSFSYLKRFPIDYLKIDGSLVRDICVDYSDQVMVSAINDIGHAMKLQTVAEFVETQADIELLQQLKVDYLQGYAINKPSNLDDLFS